MHNRSQNKDWSCHDCSTGLKEGKKMERKEEKVNVLLSTRYKKLPNRKSAPETLLQIMITLLIPVTFAAHN